VTGGGPVISVAGAHARSYAMPARTVALTFDDGPDPAFTPAVLDVLAHFGATATFFVVGRNALAHPGLVARAVAEGHVVANHTHDHRWLDRLDAAEVADEVDRGAADLAAVGVAASGIFRPPRGLTSPAVAGLTRRRGLRSVFWSDCLEAHHGSMSRSVGAVVDHAGPGSVVLAHDGGRIDGPNPQRLDRSRTVESLPGLLAGLERRRLRTVALPRLLQAGTSA
jgi:chitooligosaccharide deacetylase